jgi:uncharacterized protein YbjT (DUF2867 family)
VVGIALRQLAGSGREGSDVRVLVVGASGLIGSATVARLSAEGHDVIGVTRGRCPIGSLPRLTTLTIDVARATRPQDWMPHLVGVDAVLNCAGVFQDAPSDSTAAVHNDGVVALFRSCQQSGVRRVVHVSAVGVDREAPTAFSRSKRAGDEALMGLDLDWVILRPSVVVGRGAFGGSAMFRGLAALPIVPVVPAAGPLQIVWLDDVVRTIVFFLQPDAPSRHAVELVGPRRWRFEDVVRLFRRWLRWPPAPSVRLPAWLARSMYWLGDAVALLGWRPSMRSTAGREIVRGAVGDPSLWTRLTGITPADLEQALAAEPAPVQERWFARLYLLKALVFAVLSGFWILTGLISLGPGYSIGKSLLEEGGAGELAGLSVIAGALTDIAIGAGIAWRPTARLALYAALGISLFYAAAGSVLVPRLWLDPLGPMLKILPIMALNLVALAIIDDR